ncbi:MAG: class I SAM-dependent methyltransferase [Pseudomonadota bacterium]
MQTEPFDFWKFYRKSVEDGLGEEIFQWKCAASVAQYRTVYRVTEPYLTPGMRALDWGCGAGHFSYYLLNRGLTVSGYDYFPHPAVLKDRADFDFTPGLDGEPSRLPFDDDSFDLVFSIGVLEHVYEHGGDEVASMHEIRRVLKPGGRFLCFHFPNTRGWIEPFGKSVGMLEHFHHRKYDLADIRRFADATGFEVLEHGRYNFLPRNQARKLPKALSDTPAGVAALDAVDGVLGAALRPFTQNWYFTAKPKG